MNIIKGLIVGNILMSMSIPIFAESIALAIPENSLGKVGQNIVIRSKYQYFIENTSSSYQDYIGYEELLVDNKKYKNPLKFSLPPHDYISKGSDYLSFAYHAVKPGNFKIRSSIKIEGFNGAAYSGHSELKIGD